MENIAGRRYAVIVDEAHSSRTGTSASKLKTALVDTEAALKEYAEIEGIAEDEIDKQDRLVQEMLSHGKHKNLSFFTFTATPKPQTLEMFGLEYEDGSERIINSLKEQARPNAKILIAKTISSVVKQDTILLTNKEAVDLIYSCFFNKKKTFFQLYIRAMKELELTSWNSRLKVV